MEKSEIIKDFEETGALLHGHFLLRSGLHSDSYFQAALLLQHTLLAAKLCAALAESFKDMSIETVISPAIGGIIVGQEVGRALGVKAVFAEKDDDSNLVLRHVPRILVLRRWRFVWPVFRRTARRASLTDAPVSRSSRKPPSVTFTCSNCTTWLTTKFTHVPPGRTR